jgi:hypothetical protein
VLIAAVLTLICSAPTSACPQHTATILPDGSVEIEGKRYGDPVALKAGLKTLRCRGKDAEIVLNPNSLTKYEALAKAISMFQKTGGVKIGFVNTQQYSGTR